MVSIEQRIAVTRLARVARFMIRAISLLFPMTFAWLSFRNVSLSDVASVFSTSHNDVIWKTTIFIYFTSWILGATSDVNDQEYIYLAAPNGGWLPAIPFVALMAVCGLMLIYSQTYEMFAMVLALFMGSYYLGWRWLGRLLAPIIKGSRSIYLEHNNIIGAERLAAVEDYVVGKWQLYRFVCGAVIVALFLTLAAINKVRPIEGLDATAWEAARSISMLAFVLIMDAWLWAMRVRTKATLSALGRLGALYELKPRAQPTAECKS